MPESLCISVTFLDPRFHGRSDGGAPEWPPSPMRLFQALVAGNGPSLGTGSDIDAALRWLEAQPPPAVLAPPSQPGVSCPLYVPNNAMDLVAKGWARGNDDASIAEHRTLKTVRPTHLRGGDTVHYLWPIKPNTSELPPIEPLKDAVERMVALGWGIDLVVAQCRVLSSTDPAGEGLERWDAADTQAASTLRCPVPGSLDALMDRHAATLNRLADDTFHPVPPLTAYRSVGFRRPGDPVGRPAACFELRQPNGEPYALAVTRMIHLAGMLRHAAIKLMQQSPPPGDLPADWVQTYVAGHRSQADREHRQLSYIPLPSIGQRHTDPSVRRVMIAGHLGDEAWLKHLAGRLAGTILEAEHPDDRRPMLAPVSRSDNVTKRYLNPSQCWHSVSPVILPGNDDGKPAKTRKLIRKALEHAGIEQPCSFAWHKQSRFPKLPPALTSRPGEKVRGFLRPDHLLRYKAVHLSLEFEDEQKVCGPLVLGAGRHYGLGLLAQPNHS